MLVCLYFDVVQGCFCPGIVLTNDLREVPELAYLSLFDLILSANGMGFEVGVEDVTVVEAEFEVATVTVDLAVVVAVLGAAAAVVVEVADGVAL